MIKIKILKILPYWLMSVVLFVALQASVFFISQYNNSLNRNSSEQSAQPQVLGASTSVRGEGQPPTAAITKKAEPEFSKISAKSFLVFDLATGQELMQKNTTQKLSIASLTKLLTGLVAYKNTDLNANFTVYHRDTSGIKPVLGLVPGDEVKALDVFNAMLIGSCNDAALTLADFTTRSTQTNFIDLMNAEAKNLGMASSNFSNPMGFDSQYNYSTAADLKILITETEKLAAFANLGRRTEYEFSGKLNSAYSTVATNKLLKNHPDILAIKTGFTEGSGGAMATKVKKNNREIVILVLSSGDREGDTLKLKDLLDTDFSWN
ncbi:MAG: D-alanyl-D-alanine carboxypeptidase [Candidatus Doudnabacteria bacterium]|nr:D-alanyl-D-alanine carboxypeptidase [Candidatus Doudnabacteria bacterium]